MRYSIEPRNRLTPPQDIVGLSPHEGEHWNRFPTSSYGGSMTFT